MNLMPSEENKMKKKWEIIYLVVVKLGCVE